MFGLFYTLAQTLHLIGSGVKVDYEEHLARDRGKERLAKGENNMNVWIDRFGQYRDLDTDEVRVFSRGFGGEDDKLLDSKGNVIRNLSLEKRIKEAAKLAAQAPEGTKAVRYTYWHYNNTPMKKSASEYVEGTVYKNIKTGELYLSRHFRWFDNDMTSYASIRADLGETHSARFYMNMDGLLVSIADGCNEDEIACYRFMNYFNKQQKETDGWAFSPYFDFDKKHRFMNTYYCNNYQ